ncbi:MAG: TonB-dependent receptor plug domain-containing protein, partial [Candidatus Acidiferrales bacterium]
MRIRFSFLLFFMAVIFCSRPIHAQNPGAANRGGGNTTTSNSATIQGIVYDPDGRAVPDARVTLFNSLAAIGEKRSDGKGEYRFERLRSGTFTLVAYLPGFSNLSAEVNLASGDRRSIDLHLKLSAVEEQVIVSASLGGAFATQIGSSVTVVSHDEIENRDAQTVYDSLRGLPGLEINQTGRRGAVTSAFIRGGNSNYNLVMIDGIPLNDFGGGFDFGPIPASGVDHIEVTRGPESALYGSNAVAGVIDIVSTRGEGEPHFDFLGEGGSLGTWRIATGGAG